MMMAAYISSLIVGAMACTALLQWAGAGAAGARMLGGVMAGLLLGPTIFGAVAPQQFRQMTTGGMQAWEVRQKLLRRHDADLLALQHGRADPGQIEQTLQRHAKELSEVDSAVSAAKAQHQRPLMFVVIGLAALTALASGALTVPHGDQRQRWASPISIGAWSAALPGACAFVAARFWWDWSIAQAGFLASAVAIGPLTLTSVDRDAAEQAEFGGAKMIQTAGRIATVLAFSAAMASALMLSSRVAWIVAALIGATALGWVIRSRAISHNQSRRVLALHDWILIPCLAACTAARIDLHGAFAFWPIIILALLSGDGRWFGGLIGALLPGGRSGLRTMRLVMGSLAAGPAQLMIAAVFAQLEVLPSSGILALLVGALVIEMSVNVRRAFAQRIAEFETEIESE
jgi:hypothetical protein